MKLKTLVAATALAGAASMPASAVELTVTITNLTQGMHFTPRLLVAHDETIDLFSAGEAASTPLAWLAEGGVINSDTNPDDFESYLNDASRDANNRWQAFGGLLNPATTSSEYTFETDDHEYLSLLTMLVPTNDAFAGLDSWKIPTEPGTYTVNINAYDAGTEANDEINPTRAGLTEAGTGNALGGYGVPGMAAPGPTQPLLGTGGTGVAIQIDGSNQLSDDPADREGSVHIHRNVLGDADLNGGVSDLDSRVHRWLNPVARITVTVPAQ